MKFFFSALSAAIFTLSSTVANAQVVNDAFTTTQAQRAMAAQNLLAQYIANSKNSTDNNRESLEVIQSLGLAKTSENINSIRSLLVSKANNNEKVVLTRILGTLYTIDNSTGLNSSIIKDLKGTVYSGQSDIARAGTLTYSRLAFFNDSDEVLSYAKSKGFIDTDEYYGELAHILPYAPASNQSLLVSKIKDSNNRYAMEILAFTASDPELKKKIYPEAQKLLLSSLEKNEPAFSKFIGEFGLVDGVRYATWLQSVAMLRNSVYGTKYEEVIFTQLNDAKTDPRKIIAFLISTDGKLLIKSTGNKSSFQKAMDRITVFSKQLPQNVILRDSVQDISKSINSINS